MAEGGFVVKFGGRKVARCYAAEFDYDEWQYKINNRRKKPLPKKLKSITIKIEGR